VTGIPRLADDVVAGFVARATTDWPFLTLADETGGLELPHPIKTFLAVRTWMDAAELADAAASGEGTSTDNQAFRFVGDRVLISDPTGDAVSVTRPAFVRLLVRLLDVLVDAATSRHDPVLGSDEWKELIAARDRLRRDC